MTVVNVLEENLAFSEMVNHVEGVFFCPYPGCNSIFEKASALKRHYRKLHMDTNKCPICGTEHRNLATHAKNMFIYRGCEEHATLWYLLHRAYHRHRSTKREATAVAIRRLSTDKKWESKKVEKRRTPRKWSQNEIKFLKENYERMSISQISKAINRAPSSVYKKLKALGLR